jgi:hypothetical protein
VSKQSNKFQKLLTAIHACIASSVSVEESALLTDKETGEQREVDIVVRSQVGDYPLVLSVEVRDRSRRAGSGWVEEMAGKHQALQTNKLVLVSKSGFTKPAMEKARAREIETLTIEEACVTDWDLALKLEGQGVFQFFNIQFHCSAHIAGKSDWHPAYLSDTVILPSGERTSVGDIVSFVLSNPTAKQAILSHFDLTKEQEYHVVYDVPTGTLLENAPHVQKSLVKLSIGLHLDFEATPVELASGRFRGREIIYGQATAPENYLCIVMRRKENGETEGMLYDSNGFRQLLFDTTAQNKG